MTSVAERAARAMYETDFAAQSLGIQIERSGDGISRLSMRVRQDMTNGHGILHGGFIFTFADTASAYACNSSGQRTVANGGSISFLSPAFLGDTLYADATETYREGRQSIVDVIVTRDDGTTIAHCRVTARVIKGTVFDDPSEPAFAANA